MKEKLTKIMKEQEKAKASAKINDMFHSSEGRFWLLIADAIWSWLLYKLFNISSLGTILDGIDEPEEEKLPFWKDFLIGASIAIIGLSIMYIKMKYFGN